LLLLFFFFSSRRRHTRCLSDWSSDVCSSDLTAGVPAEARAGLSGLREPSVREDTCIAKSLGPPRLRWPLHQRIRRRHSASRRARSEERRVGKECRSRGWAEHWKDKE